jgi:hypothetical protein
MRRMMEHCGLSGGADSIEEFSGKLKPPGYYRPDFAESELAAIDEETAATRGDFGYSAW